MKMCNAEVIKKIKELEERKQVILNDESTGCMSTYQTETDKIDTGYNFKDTREAIASINTEVLRLKHALSIVNSTVKLPEFNITIMQSLDKRITEEFPSRVLNSIKVCVAGLCLFERMLKRFGLSFKECGGLTLEELVNAAVGAVRSSVTDDGGRLNAIETALLVFESMAAQGRLIENPDYKIRPDQTGRTVVAINMRSAFDKYSAYSGEVRRESEKLLSAAQYTKQIKKTEYFAGYNNGEFMIKENDKDKTILCKVCWLYADKLGERLDVAILANKFPKTKDDKKSRVEYGNEFKKFEDYDKYSNPFLYDDKG